MIGRLAGVIVHRGADHVVIDVRGVGYVVHVSERVLAGLPGVGEAAALWTELLVREDLMQLFGFRSLAEKEWHRHLTSVQGVGAKASMAILGALGPEALGRAIALGDWSAVAKAKGVGPKLAQRVTAELKDKAPAVMALAQEAAADPLIDDEVAPVAPAAPSPGGGAAAGAAAPRASSSAEALSALGNLGYAPGEAAAAVAEAAGAAPEADTGALVRAALKLLAPGR
ncbi:Holliday junction branch migration protein RuvA [Pseudoroseicyclus tamaricis]|uniref:Holliday junction branch migration complex subunit RuvA n=1 Tax=Pseudoroseicyclus tamaricis TaxID=2705421 RepID=A0A6B2JTF9_9RHOB|nr:Holliday junction branch migration protein RuvA [Pseudoroseicyclus tamaricis]NDV01847.1 Holliday junction branch migration protein RuvA [Pseudoroseicyclus tamaricis]